MPWIGPASPRWIRSSFRMTTECCVVNRRLSDRHFQQVIKGALQQLEVQVAPRATCKHRRVVRTHFKLFFATDNHLSLSLQMSTLRWVPSDEYSCGRILSHLIFGVSYFSRETTRCSDHNHEHVFTYWNKAYYLLIQYHWNYIQVKKLNYMLQIDILRNSSQKNWVVLRCPAG